MTENISFELKINYKPANSHPKRKELQDTLNSTRNKKEIEFTAYSKLQTFEPFIISQQISGTNQPIIEEHALKDDKMWKMTESLFVCLPCLRNFVRNLYYSLIFLIVIECLASIWWPMEFLDVTPR
jgi:hypothetical protein